MSKRLLAEFIGTFILVFAGTGAVVTNSLTNALGHVGIAMTFGLVVMALIYTFGHVSGAHFNPAVTISFLARKEIELQEAIGYIAVQILGAIGASVTLYTMFGKVANLGATLPRETWQQAFGLEVILTFILMMVILGSAVHGKAVKSFAGIAIGATVGLEAMFGGPISGASMNPARSLAPALVSGAMEHWWIYIVATILGALLATIVYRFIEENTETNHADIEDIIIE